MQILIIQPWISYRGAESVSLDQAHGLNTLGYESAVLCLFIDKKRLRKKDLTLQFILPPLVISELCKRSRIFFFLFGFWILLFLLLRKGKKFDVYNPHNFPTYLVAAFVGRIYTKKVYWTVHNFPQHGFTNPFVAFLWEGMISPFEKVFVSQLSGIISVSEKVQSQVYRKYRRFSIVLYPPVDYTFFYQILSQSRRKNQILIPTKLHKSKNLLLVLRSINKFLQRDTSVNFVFAGEGDMMLTLRNFASKKNISNNISFLGFVSKEDLRKLYMESLFVFLPSLSGEGFNITVLEALCVGTPCVVLKGSGIDRWVKKNKVGFVVNENEEAIVNMFFRLLERRESLIQVGEKGRCLVKDYSPEKYAEKLLREFQVSL